MKTIFRKHFFIFLILIFTFLTLSAQMINDKESVRDYVPDKATAIKIAEAIWVPIYGKKIFNNKPFIAELRNDGVWIVEGTLKSGKGGVPYIEIQKSDCKILKVIHGK